jgi:pyrroloquinoline quinone biosynthesis protein B
VRALILGAAAGGGVPQWNCHCAVCEAVRDGRAGTRPLTQSAIAVRGRTGPWFLVNASPDLRQQLPSLRVETHNGARSTPTHNGARSTPFRAVLLTDAEIDHAAGLLLLRESGEPINVYSSDSVRVALTSDFPLLRMLESYCGVNWFPLEPGKAMALPDSSLEVEAFATGHHPPRYTRRATQGPDCIGLVFRERDGGTLVYAPCLSELNERLIELFDRADCLLVDGTFWRDDELVAAGVGHRAATEMGHDVPLAGPGGSLTSLARIRGRTVLVHVNNTNPILLEGSEQRIELARAGVELGDDGLEIALP